MVARRPPPPVMESAGPYTPVQSTRIEITEAGDSEPVFTPWFMEMWDAENKVWRRGGDQFKPPVSRAGYENLCAEMGMNPYRGLMHHPLRLLPRIALAYAIISLMIVLLFGCAP